MEAALKLQQRNRKDNFTHAEIVALTEAYAQRKEVLRGRLKSTLSNIDKKKGREALAAEVNAFSRMLLSVDELKENVAKTGQRSQR